MVLVPEGLAGAAAPPSANGEVQFDAPWELRVFTIATALAAQGDLHWPGLQARLIEKIRHWELTHQPDDAYPYFTIFAEALIESLSSEETISHEAVTELAMEFAMRPHGHDHDHDHDHDHHGHSPQ